MKVQKLGYHNGHSEGPVKQLAPYVFLIRDQLTVADILRSKQDKNGGSKQVENDGAAGWLSTNWACAMRRSTRALPVLTVSCDLKKNIVGCGSGAPLAVNITTCHGPPVGTVKM